jgi:hypothetical protein
MGWVCRWGPGRRWWKWHPWLPPAMPRRQPNIRRIVHSGGGPIRAYCSRRRSSSRRGGSPQIQSRCKVGINFCRVQGWLRHEVGETAAATQNAKVQKPMRSARGILWWRLRSSTAWWRRWRKWYLYTGCGHIIAMNHRGRSRARKREMIARTMLSWSRRRHIH